MQATQMSTAYAAGMMMCSALVAAATVTVLRAQGDVVAPWAAPAVPPAAAEQATRRGDASALFVGDLLKISVHEMIDISGGGPAGPSGSSAVLHTFYQRMDLSGEYAIDQEGVVSLPRLGKFLAAGMLPRAFEAQLTAAFARAGGRGGEVGVAIQERRPVYLVGAVRSPGALKHAGQMVVLQAVALAGGIDRGLGNTAALIEGVREQERVGRFTHQLKRLLARRSRLEAERAGSDAMQVPAQLVALAGKSGAETLLASEQALLQLDQSRRAQQRIEAAAALASAEKETEALRAKLLQLDAQSQINGEHLNDLRRLEGLTTKTNVIRTRSEVAEIEARRQDTHAALAAAEAKLAQAEGAVARLALDHAAELAKAIAAADAEIAELRVALDSAGLLAEALGQGGSLSTPPANAARPVYEIVRYGHDGSAVLPAQEGTPLLPGDVLKVRLEAVAECPTAGPSRQAATAAP
jgi:polysaccharide biosynthesis/export protein ExoF